MKLITLLLLSIFISCNEIKVRTTPQPGSIRSGGPSTTTGGLTFTGASHVPGVLPQSWMNASTMAGPYSGEVSASGEFLIAGLGSTDTQVYSFATDSWSMTGSFTASRVSGLMMKTPLNDVLYMGGVDGGTVHQTL